MPEPLTGEITTNTFYIVYCIITHLARSPVIKERNSNRDYFTFYIYRTRLFFATGALCQINNNKDHSTLYIFIHYFLGAGGQRHAIFIDLKNTKPLLRGRFSAYIYITFPLSRTKATCRRNNC